jgi:ABC-type multidrug transport system ATPase subunit
VLDEPTVGSDPELRDELWTLFHGLAAAGVTLLISSHVMDEAARCDELLLLRHGKLLTQAMPDALRERTGAPDLEQAFLRLIRAREGGEAMSSAITLANTRRILTQLRYDPRVAPDLAALTARRSGCTQPTCRSGSSRIPTGSRTTTSPTTRRSRSAT